MARQRDRPERVQSRAHHALANTLSSCKTTLDLMRMIGVVNLAVRVCVPYEASMGLRVLASLLVAAGVAVTTFACELPMPGTTLGIFAVAGTPQTNTCGAGLSAPDPWDFNVQLSVKGSVLYWDWLDGSAILSAEMVDASANLTLSQSGNVDATVDGGLGPCDMERDDAIDLALIGARFRPVSPAPSLTTSPSRAGRHAPISSRARAASTTRYRARSATP